MTISPAFKAACARAAAFFREHPEGWHQGAYRALSHKGNGVRPYSRVACKWCAWGRVEREYGGGLHLDEREAIQPAIDANEYDGREAAIAALDRLAGEA